MGVEQPAGGVATQPFRVGPDLQPGHETGVADKNVRGTVEFQPGQGGGAHRGAALALANSTAKVSDDKCTYAAVVSGEA